MDDLVKRLPKEAAMLREISQSYARGIDWRVNLVASATMLDHSADHIETLQSALTEANTERMEQARLLGMSAERELALMAGLESLRKALQR